MQSYIRGHEIVDHHIPPHTQCTASDATAWGRFPNIKCQLIDGDMFMIRKLRETGFFPSRALNVSYTRLL